jgi:hypothetical protein
MSDNPEDNIFYAPKQKPFVSTGQPMYMDITATYYPGHLHPSSPQYMQNWNQLDEGVGMLQPVVQGVPVTSGDTMPMHSNQVDFLTRRMFWNYPRRMQNFLCLHVCYIVIQVLSLHMSISDYNDNKDTCPNFAKANMFFAIVGIAWIICSFGGVYAAIKRIEKGLRIYMGLLYAILLLTVIIAAYGLLTPDDNCDDDPPKSITLVGTALFTVFILGLFAFMATKLRRMLIMTPSLQSRPRQRQPLQQQNQQNQQVVLQLQMMPQRV